MRLRLRGALRNIGLVGVGLLLLCVAPAQAELPFGMFSPSLNLVLSVSDAEKTIEFYGDILGLKRIPNLDFPGKTYMIRYKAGDSDLRLIVTGEDFPKFTGGAGDGRGIRLMALLLPEARRDKVVQGLKEHGYDEPSFTEGKGFRYGMAYDHDGNQVELVFVDADASEPVFKEFQIGLTVSDTQAMCTFLEDVLQLEALEPQQIPNGPMKYSYKLGTTTVKFWSFGEDLPVYVGSPLENIGMCLVQFLVSDVMAVRETMVERGATIHSEPFDIGTLGTVMFVEGPDGILFEFGGPLAKRNR